MTGSRTAHLLISWTHISTLLYTYCDSPSILPQEAEGAAVSGGVRRRADGLWRGVPAGPVAAAQPQPGPGVTTYNKKFAASVAGAVLFQHSTAEFQDLLRLLNPWQMFVWSGRIGFESAKSACTRWDSWCPSVAPSCNSGVSGSAIPAVACQALAFSAWHLHEVLLNTTSKTLVLPGSQTRCLRLVPEASIAHLRIVFCIALPGGRRLSAPPGPAATPALAEPGAVHFLAVSSSVRIVRNTA